MMCSNCSGDYENPEQEGSVDIILKNRYKFESHGNGYPSSRWWVVEYDGMLRTGPFHSQEEAVEWFKRELEKDIELGRLYSMDETFPEDGLNTTPKE